MYLPGIVSIVQPPSVQFVITLCYSVDNCFNLSNKQVIE